MAELDVPVEILNPVTGELVPAGDVEVVTDNLLRLRDLRQQLTDAIAAFTDALVAESRRQGTRTLTAAGTKVQVSAPDAVEWDIEQLVDGLRAAGLPEARLNELVRSTVTYQVDGSVARQLAGASAEYKAAVEAAKRRVPKRQYVTVR